MISSTLTGLSKATLFHTCPSARSESSFPPLLTHVLQTYKIFSEIKIYCRIWKENLFWVKVVPKQCCQTGSSESDPKKREFWDCCFRENVVPHAPQKVNMYKRKYLLIWELVLLKQAFCRQEREARFADLAANRIPQTGVLCSVGMDFAPQHGSNSTPAHGNRGFWFSLKQFLPALYRPFRWKTQLPNDGWNFYEVWEKGHV